MQYTAEIAAVGYRHAQIADVAAERVDQRRADGCGIKIANFRMVHYYAVHRLRFHLLPAHDLFGKPDTFPDHAEGSI
jgi:hypothetical protein